jgi:hypothetical protein
MHESWGGQATAADSAYLSKLPYLERVGLGPARWSGPASLLAFGWTPPWRPPADPLAVDLVGCISVSLWSLFRRRVIFQALVPKTWSSARPLTVGCSVMPLCSTSV